MLLETTFEEFLLVPGRIEANHFFSFRLSTKTLMFAIRD